MLHIFLSILISLHLCFNHDQKEEDKLNIIYVNSYHPGYEPSDNILNGFKDKINQVEHSLEIIYMDTKKHTSSHFADSIGNAIVNKVVDKSPDFLVISDDPAMKYVAMPVLGKSNIKILFSGVNWSLDEYDIDGKQVSGVLEFLPVDSFVDFVKSSQYQYLEKVSVLTEDSLSELKSAKFIKEILENAGFEVDYYFTDNYADWSTEFRRLNEKQTLICLPTNGAIKDWDQKDALKLVSTSTKVPTFSFDSFMMDFVTMGFIKNEEEMGRKKGEMLIEVHEGKDIREIPVSRNYEYELKSNSHLIQNLNTTY
ncbi:ABC transporter substrate-binding protein [Mongoliibacter ruber]|uniref:ABC-type uncharacterized transport system substrate-binding protein n=1 Tax=Mongoliibacter ruber TaxID=1750599 RepID=A0A2T0WVI4_9BACT|nr:ABC transporter substrate binding protein [Mongoliibacter ruber]PRY90690.1 ABC-type uncharacterized transport system substrate-binding protein [Mongoliibacter ruber]